MVLKEYQQRLLDGFEQFLARALELKNPAAAFAESTQQAFGYALPYHPLPSAEGIPYVCLRVPTGGGKTRLAGQAIARVRQSFMNTSLTLWLVPSEPIRTQTLRNLKTPGELLHDDMKALFGAVNILNIEEALYLQAERQGRAETFTPARVKQILTDDFHIPAESIAIATGAVDELGDRHPNDAGYPQYIITVDKLREGWDCPAAYVLFSFRNTTSATAVEQVLGRVLRMPNVQRKQHEVLNRAYAYVVSNQLAETVKSLRDGFVQSGFERLDAKQMIQVAAEDAAGDLFAPLTEVTVSLPVIDEALELPDVDRFAALPVALRDRIEVSPEAGTLTLKGAVTAEQVRRVAETFKSPDIAKQVRESIDTVQAKQLAPEKVEAPAERGEKAQIPLLCLQQGDFFDVFDETALLDADWEIDDFDPKLTTAEFSQDMEAMRRASLSINELEKFDCDIYDRLDAQLALFGKESGWTVVDLVGWLDRNIECYYAERGQKVAWFNAAVTYLMEQRGFTLDELAYRKFRLRGALERKLAAGLKLAKQRVFDGLFADQEAFSVTDEHVLTLERGRYAYDRPYTGVMPLKKHFFTVIGNLQDRGEEFNCAEYIANQLENVEWWVRNVEGKPSSFSLQTASDRFYPDFIIKLKSGVFLVVEYKGAHLMDSRDAIEKNRIGLLWAARSNGRCRFVMVEREQWELIREQAQV